MAKINIKNGINIRYGCFDQKNGRKAGRVLADCLRERQIDWNTKTTSLVFE